MSDERSKLLGREYEAAKLRAVAKADNGPVWDTVELGRDYEVLGFAAPFVAVRRKSDGVRGSLTWTRGYPRFYYSFVGVIE